jgi:hypothetical protein
MRKEFKVISMTNNDSILKTSFFNEINVEFYPGQKNTSDSISLYECSESPKTPKLEISDYTTKFTIAFANENLANYKEFILAEYSQNINNSARSSINFIKLVDDIYAFLQDCYNECYLNIEQDPNQKSKSKLIKPKTV